MGSRSLAVITALLFFFALPATAETDPPRQQPIVTSRSAPRDPRGWTFSMPTFFHNEDTGHAGNQALEDRLSDDDLEGQLRHRLQGLKSLVKELPPGEAYEFHLYHPNDISDRYLAKKEKMVRRVWKEVFGDHPLTVTHTKADLLPRDYDYPKLPDGSPDPKAPTQAQLERQPPRPERSLEEKLRDPGEMRKMKKLIGAMQAAGLFGIHVGAGSGFSQAGLEDLSVRQLAVYAADALAEYGYKAYQTEISDYMYRKGLEILFNFGGLGVMRPFIGEGLGSKEIGQSIDLAWALGLTAGLGVITPQFLMALKATNRLHQMGHMTYAERQATMLKAGGFSLGSLGIMSSGNPAARVLLPITVLGELQYYWRAQHHAMTWAPKQNVFTLIDPRLYRNRDVDIAGYEAQLTKTKSIAGKSNEEVLTEMNDPKWQRIPEYGKPPRFWWWVTRGLARNFANAVVAAPGVLAKAVVRTPGALFRLSKASGRGFVQVSNFAGKRIACGYGLLVPRAGGPPAILPP